MSSGNMAVASALSHHEAVLSAARRPDALLVRAFAAIELSFHPLSATTGL
jgi:hypothetical protein